VGLLHYLKGDRDLFLKIDLQILLYIIFKYTNIMNIMSGNL